MALKVLLLRKQKENKEKELAELRAKDADFERREEELTTAISEVENDEQRGQVEEMVTAFETERKAHRDAISALEEEVRGLTDQIKAEEEKQDTTPPAEEHRSENERGDKNMEIRTEFFGMNMQERTAFFADEGVTGFLRSVRGAMGEKRAINNVGLTIPVVMLDLLRKESAKQSRLLPFVRMRHVSGETRQNVMGNIPEAVWMEACGTLNELDLTFNQVEVDGYQVGGYIPVCNATLQDSDVALATEIMTALSGAIAKAIDKAILFGTGVKMPVGIVTRLAQTAQPANWDSNGPAWTDLHSTNVQQINIDASPGSAFFAALIEKLAIAKPIYNSDGLFWVMNRKTHLHIKAKALAFDSSAALQSNTNLFPVIGGTVIEMEDDRIADNDIIGGFGGNYLMAEREGAMLESSDQVFWLKNQTAFKGWARYDGKPVAGEAFVIVNFANSSPTTTASFPEDYANTAMNDLAIVATASTNQIGKTVLTVSGALADDTPVLKYKLGAFDFDTGAALPSGFSALTSGTTEITAGAGKTITVVELDGNDRIVSEGQVKSVPKSA